MFIKLKEAIQGRYNLLAKDEPLIFHKEVDREKIWDIYLSAFKSEEQQSHNCNSCKSFLRQFSGIVFIKNNTVMSIWDIDLSGIDEEYHASITAVKEYIDSLPISNVFLTETRKLGNSRNFDSVREIYWDHLSLELESTRSTTRKDNIDSKKGEMRTAKEVFKRGLDELTIDAAETVLELIGQNSLYRGKEFEPAVKAFLNSKRAYEGLSATEKDAFCWTKCNSGPGIRNTAIGTLLINLSEGMALDTAVSKFEAVVAPTNYKRPTALITPRMIEDAKEKIQELGFLESLDRRFATYGDVKMDHVLFVDRSSELKDVFSEMQKGTLVNPKTLTKVEEISIQDFIDNVLPASKSVEVLLEGSHLPNFVSILTACNPTAPSMFKWDNPFSWSYTGGITDAIKEKVKAAGGRVDGELRISLAWSNYDDLDLHVHEPGGTHIYFRDKRSRNTGGELDVDMNAGGRHSRTPVENVIYPSAGAMREGQYQVRVHNFSQRETIDVGFSIEIECRGQIFTFDRERSPKSGAFIDVCTLNYSKKDGITIEGEAKQRIVSKEKWGVKTNQFTKVKNIMLSPNYWETNATGNKHFMFILEGCVNDEQVRPFFNEYLRNDLDVHRKVFEVMAGKLKVDHTPNQLSGVGFSETQNNTLIVQVTGSFKRILKINF